MSETSREVLRVYAGIEPSAASGWDVKRSITLAREVEALEAANTELERIFANAQTRASAADAATTRNGLAYAGALRKLQRVREVVEDMETDVDARCWTDALRFILEDKVGT